MWWKKKRQSTTDSGVRRESSYVQWFPVEDIERQISLRFINHPSTCLLHWGDEASELVGAGATATHTYRSPARYQVVLQEPGPGPILAEAAVTIRPGTSPAGIEFGPDPANPGLYQARFTPAVDTIEIVPRLEVDWDDGTSPDQVWAVPGTSLERPLPPGTYSIMVRDLGTGRTGYFEQHVTGPDSDPDCAFTPGATDRDIVLTVTRNTTGGPLCVSWGDGTPEQDITGDHAAHAYPGDSPDVFLVQLFRADRSAATAKTVPVPLPGGTP